MPPLPEGRVCPSPQVSRIPIVRRDDPKASVALLVNFAQSARFDRPMVSG